MPYSQKNIGASFSAAGRWRIPFVLMGLVLLCLAIYGNTLHVPFVFDDIINITKNPRIRMRDLSLSSLAEVLKSRETFRPLPNLTLAVNYYLNRFRTPGYHLVNWLIHVINGLLIYLLARQTLGFLKQDLTGAPFLAAALWLANPVHTQSVTYIVQRMNSLAAMFYLASLVLYIRARTVQRENKPRKTAAALFCCSAISGICALASKEITVTLPVMVFLYEWFFIRDLETGFVKNRARYLLATAVVVTLIAVVYLKADPLTTIRFKYARMPFTMGERLLTQPRVILSYITLLLLPMPERLTIDHYLTVSTSLTNPPATLVALGLLLSIIALAVLTARRNRLFSYALLWFLITLSVESSFVGLALMFEHRTYLPSVFLFVALTCGLMKHIRPKWLAAGTLMLLIAVSGFWTRQRNAVWTDEVTFWQDAIKKSPRSVRPYNNLGVALAVEGRYEEGIEACRKSIALSPPVVNTANAYNNISRMYNDLGEKDKALENGLRAIEIDPQVAEGYLNAGKVLVEENRFDEAIRYLEASLRLASWMTPVYTLLARAYYQKTGDTDKAIALCRQALTIDPDDLGAENFLGALLQRSGDLDQALSHLRRVLDVSPANPLANLNAGIVLNKLHRPGEAIGHLTRVVNALPDNVRARAELGSALMALNRLEEAQTHFVRALDLSPHDPAVLAKLATIKERQQQLTAAAAYYKKALAIAPDSLYCLNQLAIVLAGLGRFDEAAGALEKLEKLLPHAPTVSFNLACLYARQNRTEKAVNQLDKALSKGYKDWHTLQADTDLESIRDTPYYKKLITSLDK